MLWLRVIVVLGLSWALLWSLFVENTANAKQNTTTDSGGHNKSLYIACQKFVVLRQHPAATIAKRG
jgi:hypothetical protein